MFSMVVDFYFIVRILPVSSKHTRVAHTLQSVPSRFIIIGSKLVKCTAVNSITPLI